LNIKSPHIITGGVDGKLRVINVNNQEIENEYEMAML